MAGVYIDSEGRGLVTPARLRGEFRQPNELLRWDKLGFLDMGIKRDFFCWGRMALALTFCYNYYSYYTDTYLGRYYCLSYDAGPG